MKNATLTLAAIAILAAAGCKGPKTGQDDLLAQSGRDGGDFADMTALPPRGDFNPDKDVDYDVLRQGTMAGAGVIYFETDASTIPADQRDKLERVAKWLTDNPGRRIVCAGHCDDRGTLEYNRTLGERRSIAVRDYLIGLQTTPGRVFTHSYGEEKPAVQGAGDSVWAKNRRVEIGVVTK